MRIDLEQLTATINIELGVGTLQESVTVFGARQWST